MKDIHEVLRHKQLQHAQLTKQIELLQQAAEKLREVAPLLAENETEDDGAVLGDVEDDNTKAKTAKAGAHSAGSKSGHVTQPWP